MNHNEIIAEFGVLMERLHGAGAEPRVFYPVSILPRSKDSIELAMVEELLNLIPEKHKKEAGVLLAGLNFVSRFLPDNLAEISNVNLIESISDLKEKDFDAYTKLIS